MLVKHFLRVTSKNVFEIDKQIVFEIDEQNVFVKQGFSWWPNAQACLASKIRNVCQANLVRLAGALDHHPLGQFGLALSFEDYKSDNCS